MQYFPKMRVRACVASRRVWHFGVYVAKWPIYHEQNKHQNMGQNSHKIMHVNVYSIKMRVVLSYSVLYVRISSTIEITRTVPLVFQDCDTLSLEIALNHAPKTS